jgi:hypothetical protein
VGILRNHAKETDYTEIRSTKEYAISVTDNQCALQTWSLHWKVYRRLRLSKPRPIRGFRWYQSCLWVILNEHVVIRNIGYALPPFHAMEITLVLKHLKTY